MEQCEEYVVGRGLCRKHYARMRNKGSTDDTRVNARGVCSVDGCGRPQAARGLCHSHWKTQRRQERKAASPRLCVFCGGEVDPRRTYFGEESYCSRKCKAAHYKVTGRAQAAVRRSYYLRRYGITADEADAMRQAGCAICKTQEWPGRHGVGHIDHCHKTGRIRGVLCSECNTGVGKFRDDPALLRAAADYLEAHCSPVSGGG